MKVERLDIYISIFKTKQKKKNFDQDQYMSYDSYNGKKNS